VFGDCDIMADMKVRVVAKSTLERFKHQNIILKKFGKDGIVLYKLIKGDILVSTLKKRVQIPPEVVDEIISFMIDQNIIEQVEGSENVNEDASGNTDAEKMINEEISSNIDLNADDKDSEDVSNTEDNDINLDDSGPDVDINSDEQDTPDSDTDDALDIDIGNESGESDKEGGESGVENTDTSDINIDDTTDDGINIDMEEPEQEDTSNSDVKEDDMDFEDSKMDIQPDDTSGEDTSDVDNQDNEDIFLTDNEIKVKQKFGTIGLKVYDLIDGKRSVEDIAKESGISAEFVVNILDYMGKIGIIEQFDKESAMLSVKNRKEITPAFKGNANVMIENKLDSSQKSDVNIPVKLPIDVVSNVKLDMELMLKFGTNGKTVYSAIDGKKDEIQVGIDTDIPLYELEKILSY